MSKETLIGTPDNYDDWLETMNNLSEEAVLIINGPNLNFLGIREIEKYAFLYLFQDVDITLFPSY